MSTLHDDIRTLARETDRAALEEKFLEAVEESPGDLDFFLEIGNQLSAMGRKADGATLLSMLQDHYQENGTVDERVRLYRYLSEANEKERAFRLALVEALREQHAGQKVYEVFLDASGLKDRGPLAQALEKLARMSGYELGCFVHHAKGWGVGRVDDVDPFAGELVLTFEGNRRHSLPVQSALDILDPIPADDWRARAAFDRDAYLVEAREDPGAVVAAVLRQTGRSLDTKTFKEILANRLIPEAEWSKWWTAARRAALKRPDVIQDGKANRLVHRVPGEGDPFGDMAEVITAGQVLDLAQSFLRSHPDVTTEQVQQLLVALLEGSTKHAPAGDPAPLEILLLADDLAEQHGLDRAALAERLKSHLVHAMDLTRLAWVKSLRLSKRGLTHLAAARGEGYDAALLRLLPQCRGQFLEAVVDAALAQGLTEQLQAHFVAALESPASTPELLVWARRRQRDERYRDLLTPLDPKVLLKRALHLGEARGKRVDPENRRLARAVAAELVANKGRDFQEFLDGLGPEETRAWRREILGLRGLTEQVHTALLAMFPFEPRHAAAEEEDRYPYDDAIIFTTSQGLRKRQDEYDHLVNIKLPAVFEAIGKAASFGDLSENAEYTAALEERAQLTRKAEVMKNELKAARLLDPSLLEDGKVTVGATVCFRDLETGEEETFTLLGPWDADYDRGILDYRAPLSRALIGHRTDEELAVEFGGRNRRLGIVAVEPAI